MFNIIIRTVLIYITVIAAVRIMGKRQVSDMQTSELVTTLIISQVASLPLDNPERPLLSGLIPIMLLVSIEITVSLIMMKSRRARSVICGHPILVIRDGKLIEDELRRLRMTREDIYSLLRQQNHSDEKNVVYGIIEPNGSLSILERKDVSGDGISSTELRKQTMEARR